MKMRSGHCERLPGAKQSLLTLTEISSLKEVIATFFQTDPPTLIAERGDQVSLMYLQPSGSGAKSNHMRFVHCCTCCEIPPNPPFAKGGPKSPPFAKGAARSAGGFLWDTVPILCGLI